jgi:hypothetical protein
MARVYWTDEARQAFDALPSRAQRAIAIRLPYLEQFPEMYPLAQEGRYRGYRHFIAGRLQVFYRVLPESGDCYIRVIRPARARPE